MYPIFRPLLNKGGAGRSLSREDTAEALKPLVEQHGRLLAAYAQTIRTLADRQLAAAVEPLMPNLRTELGKLRETILANAGVPPSGIGLRDEPSELGSNDGQILHTLEQHEREYRSALKEALDYPHHQIRTIAILENNVTGSDERIGALRPLVDRTPRSTRRRPVPVDEVTGLPADLPKTVQTADTDEQPAALRAERAPETD